MSASPSIVLIGFMGTGKTALGRCLAHRLGLAYLDTDAEIEARAGKTIARIFAEDGESAFREAETALLEHFVAFSGPEGMVMATGGGMPLRSENAALLRRLGIVVWLTASPEQIVARIGPALSLRPLLAAWHGAPQTRIRELLAAREPGYAAAADLCWDTAAFDSPDDAADALAEHLCQLTLPLTKRRDTMSI
jgi:shikimate kinase